MTNVLLAGFTSHWHRRKSSMRTTGEEPTSATRRDPQALRDAIVRSVPSLWSEMREQSCSIPRGLKINKNSAEGEVFLVDFPSYRTFQEPARLRLLSFHRCAFPRAWKKRTSGTGEPRPDGYSFGRCR